MSSGTVKWFSNKKGYGFLETEEGKDLFVHYSAILSEGFKTLKQGQPVEYDVIEGPQGIQASEVVIKSLK